MGKVNIEENNIENIEKRDEDLMNNEFKISLNIEKSKYDKNSLTNISNEITKSSKTPFPKISEKKFFISKEVNKGPWTPYEDKLLTEYVQKFGPKNWNNCAEFIMNRTGKQCREHWKNCLNPNLKKGNWTLEEDLLIMVFYQRCFGSWRDMIHLFENRTENAIKNRFFSQLRKLASNSSEKNKKKRSSKIPLEYLLKFLNKGIEQAKFNFMSRKKMKEEEYNKYLKKIEIKLNNKKKDRKKKKLRKIENSINKRNKYNLLGKKREKKSPIKNEEKISENEIKNDIDIDNKEITKTTVLTNQNLKKDEEKIEKNDKTSNNQNQNEARSIFVSFDQPNLDEKKDINDNLNSFLEINQMNLMDENSFIFSETNEEEKIEDVGEHSVGVPSIYFPSSGKEYLKRTNSDIISRICYNFFPFENSNLLP